MKMYCAVLINKITGEIDHCLTSDKPVTKAMIPSPTDNPTAIKTIPATPKTTHRICFCEFECESFVRGREVLESCEMENKNPKASLVIKPGSRFSSLIETNEPRM